MTRFSYTLVIPAYNAAPTIAEAIASARAQDMPPEAIVVVDDGSTDDTAAVIAGLGLPELRLIRQPNAGPGAATTRGFGEVSTPFVATLDADDLWLPHKMARQRETLLADPGLAAVFGRMSAFRTEDTTRQRLDVRDAWARSTMLARMTAVSDVGPMIDPPSVGGEMIDWLARMRERSRRLLMLEDVVALRRLRADSLSARGAGQHAGYLQVAREALRRRREAKRDGQD